MTQCSWVTAVLTLLGAARCPTVSRLVRPAPGGPHVFAWW